MLIDIAAIDPASSPLPREFRCVDGIQPLLSQSKSILLQRCIDECFTIRLMSHAPRLVRRHTVFQTWRSQRPLVPNIPGFSL